MKIYGFWYSHVGWIVGPDFKETDYKTIGDYAKYPELVWLNKNHLVPPVVLAVAVTALGAWVNGGSVALMFTHHGLSTLFVGFFLSTVILYHGTFSINSIMHKFGKQRYESNDESRNSLWLALITLGEGWHNNHHYYMASVRQGFYWWEVDITYYLLKALQVVGLVHDLKEPPAHVRDGQRKISPEVQERIAGRLAQTFCIDSMISDVRLRWEAESARGRVAWDEFRQRLSLAIDQAMEDGRESLDQLHLPELPSLDELRRKAEAMFARSPAMDDIIARARLQLAEALNRNLMVTAPLPA